MFMFAFEAVAPSVHLWVNHFDLFFAELPQKTKREQDAAVMKVAGGCDATT